MNVQKSIPYPINTSQSNQGPIPNSSTNIQSQTQKIMERRKTLPISSILPIVLRENNMLEPLTNLKVKKAWEKIIPSQLKSYVNGVEIENKRLSVHITSAAMRNELFVNRQTLIRQINAIVGTNAIKEIRILN